LDFGNILDIIPNPLAHPNVHHIAWFKKLKDENVNNWKEQLVREKFGDENVFYFSYK